MSIQQLTDFFSTYIKQNTPNKAPHNLYQPMDYILSIGGKRLRPILALLTAQGYGSRVEQALPAAMAVEVFHNFTLLHDDIMDNASLRRGHETVHKKWDENTAILSGDMMLIKAYQYLESYDTKSFFELTKVLSQTALEVCEGQQYDMDFETSDDVTIDEYMEMIRLKTAVLLGASLKMGAIVAGASDQDQDQCYQMGVQLGLAFQLQDDYLDTFGNEATFGKQIGGDIMEDKKTWLYIKTQGLASVEDKKVLKSLSVYSGVRDEKVERVKAIYQKYNVDGLIKEEIQYYSNQAQATLNALAVSAEVRQELEALIVKLNKRNH